MMKVHSLNLAPSLSFTAYFLSVKAVGQRKKKLSPIFVFPYFCLVVYRLEYLDMSNVVEADIESDLIPKPKILPLR